MAEEHSPQNCIICGSKTTGGMPVCCRCFFQYDHRSYNCDELEKKKPSKSLEESFEWDLAAPVEQEPGAPSPTLNRTAYPDYNFLESPGDLPERPTNLPESPEDLLEGPIPSRFEETLRKKPVPRDLPTLANQASKRRSPKKLFSSFSWLLDGP